jgi:hypothetical protein
MSESKVKVAAVQAAPVFLDLEASLQKALALIEKAAAEGARLAVFPEAFLPAWPVWVDEALPGEDAAWHLRLLEQSVVVPGPVTARLGAAARRRRPAPGHGGRRARGARRHHLQHPALLRPRRTAARQAPQAHAYPRRAAGLGHGRWLRPDRPPDRGGPGGRADLLGELHAPGPLRGLRPGDRHLGRPDPGHPRALGGHHAPHRPRGRLPRHRGRPRRPGSPRCPPACPTASASGAGPSRTATGCWTATR